MLLGEYIILLKVVRGKIFHNKLSYCIFALLLIFGTFRLIFGFIEYYCNSLQVNYYNLSFY